MKNKKIISTTGLIVTVLVSFAQPAIINKKAFGGTWYDYAADVKATPDGGMILIGTDMSNDGDITWNYNSVDAFVVKLNASGNVDWKRVYGGTGYDGGSTIIPTNDGGFILGGFTQSDDGDVPPANNTNSTNAWIVKTDANGNVLWKKTYGGSDIESILSIHQLSDGSYIAAGNSRSSDGDLTSNYGLDDCWLLKLDTAGNLQWQKSYGGTSYDQLSQLIVTSDGGFAFTALSLSNDHDVSGNHGGYDIWMVKTDNAGIIQWSKSIGGSGWEYSRGLVQTSNGEYVLVANSPSSDGDGAFTNTTETGGCWVVKISATGNLIWEHQYGGTGYETVGAITTDTSGNFIIASSSNSNDGNVTGHHGQSGTTDYWVFGLNSNGILSWEKSFGGTQNEDISTICLLNDGNLAVLGTTNSNNDGDVLGSGYHFGFETVHPPNSPAFDVNTGDYWMIKITAPPITNSTGIDEQIISGDFNLTPNPATENFTISGIDTKEITITDLSGRIVFHELTETNSMEHTIHVQNWNSGIYLVTLRTENGIVSKKLVVGGE
jgi:hypothetical protein